MAQARRAHAAGRMSQRYAMPVSVTASRYAPSGVNVGATGWLGTAGSGAPNGCWVGRSNSRTAPSALPIASVRLSGLTEAHDPAAAPPRSGRVTGLSVLAEYSRVQPSLLPPTIERPSGVN